MKLLFLNLLAMTLALTGCSDSSAVKAAIAYADSTLSIRPDSALTLLQSINPDKIHSSRLKAEYSLLHSIALDKNFIDLKTDSVIRPAVEYYRRKGTPEKRAQTFYYLGRIYCNDKDSENGIKALTEAETYALKTSNYNLCGLIYNTLGNLYFAQESFNDAISMYRKSGKCFQDAGEPRKKANALSYVGKTMRLMKEFDSSAVYYQQARMIYALLNDGQKVLLMNSGIAENLIIDNQYEKAINLILDGYTQYNQGKIPERDYPLWAKISLGQNNPVKSREFALTALEHKYTTGRIKSGLYALLYQANLKEYKYKEACNYLEQYSSQSLADSKKEKENLIQEILERHAKEKYQTSLSNLQKEHRYQKIIYLLILLTVLSSSYVVFIRQRNKRKFIQEQYERERTEADTYLESLKENHAQLTRRYNSIKEQNSKNDEKTLRFLRAFENRLNQMKDIMDIAYTTESTPAHFHNKFKEYINAGTKEKDAFDDLQYVVNEKYYGIIDYLKKHYPALTKSDLDLCSMLCFGFTANTIRLIYGHTNLESIFQKRSKLREKMNIPVNVQLDTFIRKLKFDLQKKHAPKRL